MALLDGKIVCGIRQLSPARRSDSEGSEPTALGAYLPERIHAELGVETRSAWGATWGKMGVEAAPGFELGIKL